jgi:ATP-dependent Zn protease
MGGVYGDWCVAIHESGHAVVAHFGGGEVQRVSIQPHATADGHTHVVRRGDVKTNIRKTVEFLLAGGAAVARDGECCDHPRAEHSASVDRGEITELFDECRVADAERLPIERAAAESVDAILTARWSTVEALAHALVERRTLLTAEINSIIAGR